MSFQEILRLVVQQFIPVFQFGTPILQLFRLFFVKLENIDQRGIGRNPHTKYAIFLGHCRKGQ
jgi:hypothetical protein